MLQRQKYKAHQCGGSHMQKYQGQRQFLCKMAEHAYEGNQDSFAYGEDQQIFQFVDEFPVVKAASLLKGAEQFQCISLDLHITQPAGNNGCHNRYQHYIQQRKLIQGIGIPPSQVFRG